MNLILNLLSILLMMANYSSHFYSGSNTYSSNTLYTWDGKYLYTGRNTYSSNTLITYDGKHIYRGRCTYMSECLYTLDGPIPIPVLITILQ